MSPPTTDRMLALRAAVAKDARARRLHALLPGEAGKYAGRYRGPVRNFSLVWDDDERGYRRYFKQDSAWFWEDRTLLASSAVADHIQAGRWTFLGHMTGTTENGSRGGGRIGHQSAVSSGLPSHVAKIQRAQGRGCPPRRDHVSDVTASC